MRRALIDISIDLFRRGTVGGLADLGRMFDALDVFGLQVMGSAPSPIETSSVRLIVETAPGHETVLPDECEHELIVVRPLFSLEQHGEQRIVRVTEIQVVGKPRMVLAA